MRAGTYGAVGGLAVACVITVVSAAADGPAAAAQKNLRLFILSGQSNMVGLKPETSFTPAVQKAFPDDEMAVVKVAESGQPIARWITPAGGPAQGHGDLYAKVLEQVKAKTGDRRPVSVAFVWMQGERDAKIGTADLYAAHLLKLFRQLRTDLQRDDIQFVVGRISDHRNGQDGWDTVRKAQETVCDVDPRAAWVDTDDLNGEKNGLHYERAGYEELGRRFAAAAIELLAGRKPAGRTPAPAKADNP